MDLLAKLSSPSSSLSSALSWDSPVIFNYQAHVKTRNEQEIFAYHHYHHFQQHHHHRWRRSSTNSWMDQGPPCRITKQINWNTKWLGDMITFKVITHTHTVIVHCILTSLIPPLLLWTVQTSRKYMIFVGTVIWNFNSNFNTTTANNLQPSPLALKLSQKLLNVTKCNPFSRTFSQSFCPVAHLATLFPIRASLQRNSLAHEFSLNFFPLNSLTLKILWQLTDRYSFALAIHATE